MCFFCNRGGGRRTGPVSRERVQADWHVSRPPRQLLAPRNVLKPRRTLLRSGSSSRMVKRRIRLARVRVVPGEGEHLVLGQPRGGTGIAQLLVPQPRIKQCLVGVGIMI